jgi:hypothetical protein
MLDSATDCIQLSCRAGIPNTAIATAYHADPGVSTAASVGTAHTVHAHKGLQHTYAMNHQKDVLELLPKQL